MAASLADGAVLRPHGAPAYLEKRSTVGPIFPGPLRLALQTLRTCETLTTPFQRERRGCPKT